MLKIEAIYDKGTAEELEDGLIINPPFFGVVDGTSDVPHFIGKGLSFGKMSGGEMARKIILETFYSAKSNDSLERVVLLANKKLAKLWQSRKIPLNPSDLIGGAAFVFAKIDSKKVNVIQGGDCFALWVMKSGKIGITKNKAYFHETEVIPIIAELMEKHKGDRKKMWLDFYKCEGQLRLRYYNKKVGFAMLNGQTALKKCWQKIEIPISNLELLFLFSDGFVPIERETKLAKKVLNFYKKGGLHYILRKKREFEKATEKESYRVYDEATAIALKFDNLE